MFKIFKIFSFHNCSYHAYLRVFLLTNFLETQELESQFSQSLAIETVEN